MEFGVLNYVFAVSVLIIVMIYLSTWNFNYWRKRRVPGPRPIPLFGNAASFALRRLSVTEMLAKFYTDWKNYPFVGIYSGLNPVLIVRDLDLVRRILVTDFHAFSESPMIYNEKVDPLLGQLLVLGGPRWKYLRSKITPFFTSSKLKHIVELLLECADHFEAYLRNHVEKEDTIECRQLAAKFTIDAIGSYAFGIDVRAFDEKNCEFMRYGRKVFNFDWKFLLRTFIRESAPKLYQLLQIQMYSREMSNFFISSVRDTMEYRKRKNFVRNDLIDILIEMKENHDCKEIEMNDGFLAAQAFIFLAAGFETSSATISFALYELAHHPEIQKKVRSEIIEYLEKYDGKIAYETIKEMKYFHRVFQETLRRNPPSPGLQRVTSEPYKIPGTDIILEKGQKILISSWGLHYDPEYFPNPEVFDPDRFTDEAKQSRHPQAYLPFGDGPKNCIGLKFAELQVKLGLITVLKNYHLTPTKNSPQPYEIDKGNFMLTCKNGVQLKFQIIEKMKKF